MYVFLAVLGLHDFALVFSLNCGRQARLFVVMLRFLMVVLLVAEHRLKAHGLQLLQHLDSPAAVHRLSCSTACGILLDQGWNPGPHVSGFGRRILIHGATREVLDFFLNMWKINSSFFFKLIY